MSLEISAEQNGRLLVVRLTGKLVKEDYATFVPAVDQAVGRHGKIRMLVEMVNFHGWTGAAMWEDTKFAVHHFHDIERLAVVGEKKWQAGLAIFCKPFTTAMVQYFEAAQRTAARAWVQGEMKMAA